MSYTDRHCSVSGFSEDLGSIQDVPVVKAATAYQAPDGKTYILIANEVLWFGDSLPHSLINPNQLRHYQVEVQDNPYHCSEPLQITTQDPETNLVIPMSTEGTIIYFQSRTPTIDELEACSHIELTSDTPWDPQSVRLASSTTSVEEEEFVSSIQSDEVFLPFIPDDIYYDKQALASRLASQVRVLDREAFSLQSTRYIGEVHAANNPDAATSIHVGEVQTDFYKPGSFQSKERHSEVTPEVLAQRWGISHHQAKDTLRVTTQKGMRSAVMPLARRYRADRFYGKSILKGTWGSDTIFGKHKSLEQNTCAQVFANKHFFVDAYPMRTKADCGKALRAFRSDWGCPEKLIVDGSKEQTGYNTEFRRIVTNDGTDLHIIEPGRSEQNPAERAIREVKKKWYRIMHAKRVPHRLWDYGFKWCCKIMQLTSNSSYDLHGRTAMEEVTGDTPNISEYIDFSFYDWCWFWEAPGLGEPVLARWLGPAQNIGNSMCYYMLKSNGRIEARSTVQRLTNIELEKESVKQRCKEFDQEIKERLNDDNFLINRDVDMNDPRNWAYFDPDLDPDFVAEFCEEAVVEDDLNPIPEADDIPVDDSGNLDYSSIIADDYYINMEISLPRDGQEAWKFARVSKRARGEDGQPIGKANSNPILDTRMFECEFLDGHVEVLPANTIAESMFAQVDEEGNRHVLLDEIVDHRETADALPDDEAYIMTKSGQRRPKPTTKGWEILVQWKDGSTNWVKMKELKESHPVQLAEYAVANKISQRPAFVWWVDKVLRKRKQIIAKVKNRYWLKTHKFGFRLPKTVQEALEIDKENGDNLWWEAIQKEMANVRPAFEKWNGTEKELATKGYQKINCHMVFDIKMGENFRRKARFVAGGHTTECDPTLTYSSVVSRDTVRIAFLVAALNDLDVMSCDIQNAYLTAKCREKIYTIAGDEFGDEKGTIMIVRQALYGLKSAGAAFWSLLRESLFNLGYCPSKADNDLWMKPAEKEDGTKIWEYILVYVDDLISIGVDAKKPLLGIQDTFKLKDDKIESPSDFLGAQVDYRELSPERPYKCWTIHSTKYVKEAVANVEKKLKESGNELRKYDTPLPSGYRPEIDETPELKEDGANYYQELVGILRWIVELGRIDLATETSMMSSHLAMPREGHLEAVIHMFGYLKKRPKRWIAMDHKDHLRWSHGFEDRFEKVDWSEVYPGAKEEIPLDRPEPRGEAVSIHCFVDADHAANRANRRSQTGILIFINSAPIIWYSKRQNTVETSTFGSEYVALRTAVDLIVALRYKLMMFGIPLVNNDGPANIYCDNKSVVTGASIPHSKLTKKHNAINWHRVRETAAAGIHRVAWEQTETNLADLLTKVMAAAKRDPLIDAFMY